MKTTLMKCKFLLKFATVLWHTGDNILSRYSKNSETVDQINTLLEHTFRILMIHFQIILRDPLL